MRNGPALTLEPYEVPILRQKVDAYSLRPEIDVLLFDLSYRAGMRVGEIAKLTPDAVLAPSGRLRNRIRISVTKRTAAREIDMHPDCTESFERFFVEYPDAGWFAMSPRDGKQMSRAALGMYITRIYDDLGYFGYTSHSGRATCLTEMAQLAAKYGCSLEDVRRFAGHKCLASTEKYLRPSERGRELVHALGRAAPHQSFFEERRRQHGAKRSKSNHRNSNPEIAFRNQQHEAWLTQRFAHARLQSERGAERFSGVGGSY